MVYGTQSIFENANYTNITVPEDYNVLAECYEAAILFEQDYSNIMSAVGAAEFTYLKENGELKVYTEADESSFKKAVSATWEKVRTSIMNAIKKLMIWINTKAADFVNKRVSKLTDEQKAKISKDASIKGYNFSVTTGDANKIGLKPSIDRLNDIIQQLKSGNPTFVKNFDAAKFKLIGASNDGTNIAERFKDRIYGDETDLKIVDNYAEAYKRIADSKEYIKILDAAMKGLSSANNMWNAGSDESANVKKIISFVNSCYSVTLGAIQKSVSQDLAILRAAKPEKAAKGNSSKKTDGDADKKPEAKNESSFLDGFLDSIY